MAQPVAAAPPVLAAFNGAYDPRAASAVLDHPASAFAQNARSLLQHVRRAPHRDGAVVVSVAALDAGLAKTSVAVALARAASQAQLRVAVIDADLHRPQTARAMGIAPQRVGLIELLTGTAPLGRAFLRDPRSNATVISTAQPVADPARILASAKMVELVAYLRRNCDVVIFSTPTGPETHAVASLSDAVVVVSREESVTRAAAEFRALHNGPVGVVLAR
jgi:Mrp family chromosome partitioning ATPase